MQVNLNDRTNFTSVVPVRVFYNVNPDTVRNANELYSNMAKNPKQIKKALNIFKAMLAGPAKNDEFTRKIIGEFSRHDKDYSYEMGYLGEYLFPAKGRKKHISDSFRSFFYKGCGFITTGKETEKLAKLGKQVGKEKEYCKGYACLDFVNGDTSKVNALLKNNNIISGELKMAWKNYFSFIEDMAWNRNKWIKMRIPGKKADKTIEVPAVLEIFMNTSGTYGKKSFEMFPSKIRFVQAPPVKQ